MIERWTANGAAARLSHPQREVIVLRQPTCWRVLRGLPCLLALVSALSSHAVSHEQWPAINREHRPWAYWWWMGSAVDKTNLTRELTRYAEAGYGGVHIIPIYGARGWESNYLNYLSPQWMEMLDHSVREANRLGMGVDMTTGTGWCFGGGPYVGEQEGNANVVVKTFEVGAGAALPEKIDREKTQALVAFGSSSSRGDEAQTKTESDSEPPHVVSYDLTKKIKADGSADWVAPAGGAKVYVISQKPSPQKVKRAAPGGEGPMLNLIYPDAMPVFLRSHTEAFANYRGAKPRAQYHDSYEYKSDWAPDFFKQFEKRRGYKLEHELPFLFPDTGSHRREEADAVNNVTNRLLTSAATERTARVLADYRETVSDIMIEDSLPQWVKWSHRRGFITRNEAHGSPGNLLDLYALADVPETEMFRLDRNKLISKFASSAAHVAGRKLTSSETGTWLKEHFTETLADMKYLVDDLFVSGVNHVFYHGTCYSPDEAAWPGWVFYASYEMNPRNSIWHDARALNDYIARCQSVLQAGAPDNDVLVYWPIHDFWQKAPAKPLLPHLTVHARGWFEGQPINHVAEELWRRGYGYDFVSDRQLAQAKFSRGKIKLPGGEYQTIVVPACDFIPLATLEKLLALAKSGAPIVFADHLPKDVPGLSDLEKRRPKFQTVLAQLESRRASGRVFVGEIESALTKIGVPREAMSDHEGLFHIRRALPDGRYYFIANRSEQAVDGWMPLATTAKSVVLMNPMTGETGVAAMRSGNSSADSKQTEIYLQLQSGESVVVRTFNKPQRDVSSWTYWQPTERRANVTGEWRVEFVSGGPTLPATFTSSSLGSWTQHGEAAEAFSGTARYSVKFDAVASSKPQWLDLGQVNQSARVKLNGKDYGTLLTPPFRVLVNNLQATGNTLEVEVTSTAANRIRDLDRRGVKWQNFRDINFVNQDYKPFNAANWPVAGSGLLGPVTLTVAQRVDLREEAQ